MKYCVEQNGGAYIVWEPSFKRLLVFLVCLTQKGVEVLEKYLQNIVRVGVEVSRGSKMLKMRDVQGYRRAPKTTFFNPKLLKNQNHNY